MMFPLIVLAIGAFLAGYLNFPGEMLGDFLGRSPSFIRTFEAARAMNPGIDAHAFGQEGAGETMGTKIGLMIISGLVALAGIGLAYVFHLKSRRQADALAAKFKPIVTILENKYWVDEIYQGLIVEPLRILGKLLANVFDRFVVDGLVNLAGMIPQAGGVFLKITVQRGFLQGYAAAMLFGVAIILLVIFLH